MIGGITGKPGAKIAVEHEYFRGGVRVLLWNEDCYYRCTFEQVPHDDTMSMPVDESFLRFSTEEAQALCQALSDAGFKPDGGSGGPAQIEALKANLNDIRQMVSIETGHVTRLLTAVGMPALSPPHPPLDEGVGKKAPGDDE